jgi:hypothetical protein
MDASITRRSQPCWYRVAEVGMIAINDSFMLEAAVYRLIKVHFKGQPYYVDLVELFQETTYQTEMGQLIDLITAPEDHVDLSKFSLEKYVINYSPLPRGRADSERKAPTYCDFQNGVLLILSPRRAGVVHVQYSRVVHCPRDGWDGRGCPSV